MVKQQFEVLSPDGFGIEMDSNYPTYDRAKEALTAFVKQYEAQGYYSTIINGERIRLTIAQISDHCKIIQIK